jgi:Tfp pilus assembly protein PilF
VVAAVAPTKPPPAPGAKAPAAVAVGTADRDANFPKLLEKCREAFNQGKMREATTVCSAAKDANTESGDALLLLAHAEFNRNHLKEALQWAEKAIKADPNLAEAYVIFGGVQQDAGKNREAKWAYKKYLELAPRGQYAADLRAIVDTL